MKQEPVYQHEIIVPNEGFPFKLFLFEGMNGSYIRQKHWHNSIELFMVEEGSLRFQLGDDFYPMQAQDFILVNSNEVHAIYAPEPNRTIVLQIPISLFLSYFTEEQFIWFSHRPNSSDGQTADILRQLYLWYEKKETGYELQMLRLFYELMYLMVTQYRKLEVREELLKGTRQRQRLGIITAYLKEHYREELSLEQLASVFGYSTAYLSRMFVKYAGIHYKEYLQSVRLEHAVRDLIETDRPIGEIALEHGFPNSKSFSKLFQKLYGELPKEYRKHARSSL